MYNPTLELYGMSDNSFIPMSAIDSRIEAIGALLARLPIELDALRRLRNEAVHSLASNVTSNMRSSGDAQIEIHSMGPRQAVLFWINQEGSVATKDLIESLKRYVNSAALDVGRTLYSTLSTLKKNGMVRESGGLLELTERGKTEVNRK